MNSQKTDVSCFSGNLFFGQLTLESLNGSLMGRTDVLWNLHRRASSFRDFQSVLLVPTSLGWCLIWAQLPQS